MKNHIRTLAATLILLALTTLRSPAQSRYEPYTFTTLAGLAGYNGSADGTGREGQFSGDYYADGPTAVAVDNAGNVYAADSGNSTIRKITPDGVVTTLAGLAGNWGSADGTGSAALFNSPFGVAVDGAGNVYVADSGNGTVRKVTPAGRVTTLAGSAGNPAGSTDGAGSAARFSGPAGVAVDSAGNLYVADTGNSTIRKVTPVGVVTTLAGLAGSRGSADGSGSAARFGSTFSGPQGVAVDTAGNVYVADTGNFTIRKVTPEGVVTTLAGLAGSHGSADGSGSAARFGSTFSGPQGVAVDTAGNVYVADTGNFTIRKVTPEGVVTTLAGVAQFDQQGNPIGGSADGTGSASRFNLPLDVAVDSAGNVCVADSGNYTVRKGIPAVGPPIVLIRPQSQTVTATYDVTLNVVANGALPLAYQWRKDGVEIANATEASYHIPNVQGFNAGAYTVVLSNLDGAVTSSNAVLTVPFPYAFTTLAGLAQLDTNGYPVRGSADGAGSAARFFGPSGMAVDSAGNVYLADTGNNTIRKVTPAGVTTTLAGLARSQGIAGELGGPFPSGVAVDGSGNVYVADKYDFTILKVTPLGVVTTLAGLAGSPASTDGTGSNARFGVTWSEGWIPTFAGPSGVAVDSAGNVYVADSGNNTIRKVTPAGEVTTLAGLSQLDQLGKPIGGSADGTGSAARFNSPSGVAVDTAGNVYVADSGNNAIRKVTPSGVVTTLAGNHGTQDIFGIPIDGYTDGIGSEARFWDPSGVAVDSAGNVYVVESANNTIRKVTPAGVVTTLAGLAASPLAGLSGSAGSTDGTGSTARFNGPSGVAVDSAGNVYVADSGNNTIRKGFPALMIQNSGPAFGFNPDRSGFGFNLAGPVGQSVVVEASSDLVSWLPIWTNTFAGTLNFSDPQSAMFTKRFYRVRTP